MRIEFENYECVIHGCKQLPLENTAYLPNSIKMFLFNPEENIFNVYECAFFKGM